MRPDKPRLSKGEFAALGGGLGLLLWATALVWRPPNATGEQLSSEPSARSERLNSSSVEQLLEGSQARGTNAPATDATSSRDLVPVPAQSHPRGDAPSASFETTATSAATQATANPLPLGHEEISQDGLPANALHCTQDGGVLNCGSCSTDGDCPPGQGCVPNRETRRFECMTSECEEDVHCFPGSVCRALSGGTSDLVIRRCVTEGVRREGETCDAAHLSRASACREGLRCIRQVCTVPCQLDDPGSCPNGYECADSVDGPGCVPDCQKLGCAQGQQCKQLNTHKSQCLSYVSGTCPETPCAEGERCNQHVWRGRGAFWCARLCNPLRPESCPPGHVCGNGGGGTSTCYRACDHTDLDSCGKGWMCATASEDFTLWGCQPTLEP